MAANYTANYNLCQWEATDQVLRTDFNQDNAKIEAALSNLEERVAILDRMVPDLAYYMGHLGILSILKWEETLPQWSMVCDAFQKPGYYSVTGQAVVQNGVLTVDGTGTATSLNYSLGREDWKQARVWVRSSGTGTINVYLNGHLMTPSISDLNVTPSGEVALDQLYLWNGTGTSSAQVKLDLNSNGGNPLVVYDLRMVFC